MPLLRTRSTRLSQPSPRSTRLSDPSPSIRSAPYRRTIPRSPRRVSRHVLTDIEWKVEESPREVERRGGELGFSESLVTHYEFITPEVGLSLLAASRLMLYLYAHSTSRRWRLNWHCFH